MKRHLSPIFDDAHRWWTISFFIGSVALLGFQGEPARKALLDILQEEDRDRDRVMWALGKMKETRAVEPLVRLLSNDKWREWAVPTLGNIGDPRAVEPLIASLKKYEGYTNAQNVLKEITGQDLKTSDGWARWWEQNKKTKQ